MVKQTNIYLFLFLVALASCGTAPEEYIDYMENPVHGLAISKQTDGLELGVQYKPVEYVLIRERHTLPSQGSAWRHGKEELGELQYFSFSLEGKSGQAIMERKSAMLDSDLATYFSFDLERDFYLLEGNDSLPCVLFHWVRHSSLSPKETFLLAFPKPNKQGDRTLVYNDRALGIGPQRFHIKTDDINSIPKID